jgi:catechol 2,3-dioxygenase-like lactoylglutathione lyase family enzyme
MNLQYVDAQERKHSAQVLPRGVHHLALTTDDMKGTTQFYASVLGMPLVHAMKVPPGLGTGPKNRGNPPYEEIRHYFFDMGNDSLMAFFEIPKGSEPHANRNAVGGMQHVAISVTRERFEDILGRLEAHGIPNSGPIEQLPGMVGVYFFDPSGIRLEFACQPSQGDGQHTIAAVTQTKDEARRELESLPGADADWIDGLLDGLPD